MGLIGGMARTAVVAGTATAVSNRVSRRQANRWAAKEQQQSPQQQPAYAEPAYQQPPQQAYQQPPQQPVYVQAAPAAADPVDDGPSMLDQLTQLGQLKDAGVLTEQEFQTQKARILAAG